VRTPHSTAASSLCKPRAIAFQNRCRSSLRATAGRPGDRIAGRIARSARRSCVVPQQPLIIEVLRRPVESTQYTALSFGKRLEEVGIVPSMGRTGSALDNAMAESFVSTLKVELVDHHRFPTRGAARMAIFEYIEGFYNRMRRHSSLGYESPQAYETSTMEGSCGGVAIECPPE
jgi:transposase InsO family protein